MEISRVTELIEQGLSTSFVRVEGDGVHFEAVVVSEQFQGKSMIDCHKLVYAALGDAMDQEVHSISIKTYTEEQWRKFNR